MQRKSILKRLTLSAACLILAFTTVACSSEAPAEPGSVSQVESSSVTASASSETPAETETPKAKTKVTDFYEEINAEWVASHSLDGQYATVANRWVDKYDLEDELDLMFQNATAETFQGNEGMQKLLAFYNQLEEANQDPEYFMPYIKKAVEKVRKTKTMDQFYALLNEDDTATCFDLIQIRLTESTSGMSIPYIYGVPYYGLYSGMTDTEKEIYTKGIRDSFMALGYSESESSSIAANCLTVQEMICEAYSKVTSSMTVTYDNSYSTDPFGSAMLKVLKDRGYAFKLEYYKDLQNLFFIDDGYYEFLNTFLTKENLPLINDFYAAGVVTNYAIFGNEDLLKAQTICACDFSGIVGYETHLDEMIELRSSLPIQTVIGCDQGILAAYYAEQNVTEDTISGVAGDLKTIQSEIVSILDRIDWLDVRSLERLKVKVKKIQVLNGKYPTYNTLENYTLADNAFDSMTAFNASNRAYAAENFVGDKHEILPDSNLFDVNAYYYQDNNAIVIALGLYQSYTQEQDIPFEVRLATYGATIAHEVGHAYAPNCVNANSEGIYEELFNDEQWDKYYNSIYTMAAQLNERTTRYGNTLYGWSYKDETFADLLAMEVCLRILEKQENPDYELFFTTYAQDRASISTPTYENLLLRTDSHLPDCERVNFVLGQFDKFYEVYDVDESSEWYVAPENRVRLFQ